MIFIVNPFVMKASHTKMIKHLKAEQEYLLGLIRTEFAKPDDEVSFTSIEIHTDKLAVIRSRLEILDKLNLDFSTGQQLLFD